MLQQARTPQAYLDLLIGVISSIGAGRDAQGVDGVAQQLKDADPAVASAAGFALGQIGDAGPVRFARSVDDEAVNVFAPAVLENRPQHTGDSIILKMIVRVEEGNALRVHDERWACANSRMLLSSPPRPFRRFEDRC